MAATEVNYPTLRHCVICDDPIPYTQGSRVDRYNTKKTCKTECTRELYRRIRTGTRNTHTVLTKFCQVCGQPIYRKPNTPDWKYNLRVTCGALECTKEATRRKLKEADVYNELDACPETVNIAKLIEGVTYTIAPAELLHQQKIGTYRMMWGR